MKTLRKNASLWLKSLTLSAMFCMASCQKNGAADASSDSSLHNGDGIPAPRETTVPDGATVVMHEGYSIVIPNGALSTNPTPQEITGYVYMYVDSLRTAGHDVKYPVMPPAGNGAPAFEAVFVTPTADEPSPHYLRIYHETGAFERVTLKQFTIESDHNLEHWGQGAKIRHEKQMQDPAQAAGFNNFMSKFEHLRHADFMTQVRAVNNIANDYIEYESDDVVYGEGEYYASPLETIRNQRGDCEDYAILKYYVLRALGYPENRLYLTCVNEELSEDGSNHAILMANVAPEKQTPVFMMLENQTSLAQMSQSDYAIYTMFNESGYWQYNPAYTASAPVPEATAPKQKSMPPPQKSR